MPTCRHQEQVSNLLYKPGRIFRLETKNRLCRPYPNGTFSVIKGEKRSGYPGQEKEFSLQAKNRLCRPYPNGTFSVIEGVKCYRPEAVGQVSMTLSKNDQRWGVLNLLRRFLAAEWEMAEQVRDSRATQWGTFYSKGHFSTKSSIPAPWGGGYGKPPYGGSC